MVLDIQVADNTVKSPFRFFNIWADHDKFLPLVRRYWANKLSGDNMKGVWMNLKALKPHLKQLNNNNFRGVTENIACIRTELIDTQARMAAQYTESLAENEKNLLQHLEKWSLIEEGIYQQKSRATWIKLGDANTKYFTAVMKERRYKKQIVTLKALNGDVLVDPKAIQLEIINFYNTLMGSAAPRITTVNKITMRNVPVLNHAQQFALCTDVTDMEIFEGLCSIGNEKAPGVDGFNALFF
ncbi:hypothetical protein P3S68_017171 [Capsicum galapagoense]